VLLQSQSTAGLGTRGLCRVHVAFWCGELVQMVTGDLFTYWRNLVVFFAALALVQDGDERSLSEG